MCVCVCVHLYAPTNVVDAHATDTKDFGEHAASLMVKHGLLNEDDLTNMIDVINRAELIQHASQ